MIAYTLYHHNDPLYEIEPENLIFELEEVEDLPKIAGFHVVADDGNTLAETFLLHGRVMHATFKALI